MLDIGERNRQLYECSRNDLLSNIECLLNTCLFHSVVNMSSTNSINPSTIRSILEKEKLNGTNFLDWHQNLRIALKYEKRETVLETPIPVITPNSTGSEKNNVKRIEEASREVTCIMLGAMEPAFQRQFEHMDAYSIIEQLKSMFGEQARIERFNVLRDIMDTKLQKGKPVGPHVQKMMGLFATSERLGFPYEEALAVDIVLHSLHDGYDSFRTNYHVNGVQKSLMDLHGLLKTVEPSIKSNSGRDVLMIKEGGISKRKNKSKVKGKGKAVAAPKAKNKKKNAVGPICFYCNGEGHYKRDCSKYKEDVKNGVAPSSSGIFVVDIHFSDTTSWVLDTGCGTHIVRNVQGLQRSKKLEKGEVHLRVGNGARSTLR